MTGSDYPGPTYVGHDEVGRVDVEIDGVLHVGGLPPGLRHFSQILNCDGDNLDDGFGDPIGNAFRSVNENLGGTPVENNASDNPSGFPIEIVDGNTGSDDDDEDDDETVDVEELVSSFENAEEVHVRRGVGGLGDSVFRFGNNNTILVEESSNRVAKEPDIVEPNVGMSFEMGEEFIAYIHRYGHSVGFGARIFGSDKVGCGGGVVIRKPPLMEVIDGAVISGYVDYYRIKMCCRKEGKHKSKSSNANRSVQTCKTGCMFFVTARRNPKLAEPWRITSIRTLLHNHKLHGNLCRFIPRYRTISPEDQLLILELHKSGVVDTKIYDVFLNKWKGYKKSVFTETDLHNFIYLHQRKRMKDCDFAAMEAHFKIMREACPEFYYDFEIDKENRLKSVFWADARCRDAFKYFGDVVSFDTTFVSNRYRMPFAPFVGLNHHGKTMLFGCGLISSEDTNRFVWLFETWKKCMGGYPLRILTDQDKAIGKAVEIVFPYTTHRWCLWHVMRNCTKHLGMRCDWDEMYTCLKKVLHDSFDVEEFESGWREWVSEYELSENTWVRDMYQFRSRWCLVYFKSDFWAGMSSTQRSEGMNHYFKGYVNLNTCLTEFLEKCAKGICKRIDEEEKDDFQDEDLHSLESTVHAFEPIFEKLFTRSKFLEFHKQLRQFAQTGATKVSENEVEVVYDVLVKSFRVGWSRKSMYRVHFVKDALEAKCECKNFEFRGILCAHALRVYWMEDTMEVPEKFVPNRWRKDIPREYVKHIYPEAALMGKVSPATQRYHEMKKLCDEMSTMVMNDGDLHNEVLLKIKQLKGEVNEKTCLPVGLGSYLRGTIGRVYKRVGVGENTSFVPIDKDEDECSLVKDPIDKRGRGRVPMKRKQSTREKMRRGRGRARSVAGGLGRGNDINDVNADCQTPSHVKIVCKSWQPGTPMT